MIDDNTEELNPSDVDDGPDEELMAMLREAGVSDETTACFADVSLAECVNIGERLALLRWLKDEIGVRQMGERQKIANAVGRTRRALGIGKDESDDDDDADGNPFAGLSKGQKVQFGHGTQGLITDFDLNARRAIVYGFGEGVPVKLRRREFQPC